MACEFNHFIMRRGAKWWITNHFTMQYYYSNI